MSKVLCSLNSIFISSDKLYCFEPENNVPVVIEFNDSVKDKPSNKPEIIDCMDISICHKWLAACFKKEIRLFSNYKLHSFAVIDKSAIQVLFFNTKNIILVADRSGGVSFYDFTDSALKKTGECMGHNSMLTDALISKNDLYIITSDRDEKIRVSCYPNVYNIQSFCLGHEQFVSSISFLPNDENILVSSSGDGTVRLWDYQAGRQLLVYRELQKEKSIVKAICVPSDSEILIVVQFYKCEELTILSVTGRREDNLSIKLKAYVTVALLIDLSPFKGNVVCLINENTKLHLLKLSEIQDDPLEKFVLNAAKFLQEAELISNLDTFNIMFKREYDNVQEYQAKKRARIINKLSN